VSFVKVFRGYFKHFDEVLVFANLDGQGDSKLIAEKVAGKTLDIVDEDVFNGPLFVPTVA
jgi:hypothetical protein